MAEMDEAQRALADSEVADADVRGAAGAREKTEKNNAGFKLTVLYNGLEREIAAKPEELVKKLLADAIAAFPSVANPHTLSLFSQDGRELNDAQTVHDAGVKPHETLLLRPGAVKGGGQ